MVVEPAAIAEIDESGLRLLYIALTRATKYLTIVHARAFAPLDLDGIEEVQITGGRRRILEIVPREVNPGLWDAVKSSLPPAKKGKTR